ncbi:type II toxin-antitoxin system VapC family toxin [Microlunatus sp. GCM10028923]|uniref:type II toxin-antitoxin system VapC family toxin n=1 Tax=Microlunatus sp. GCM10028923 TaxID=3273400 RepID=UPI00362115C4
MIVLDASVLIGYLDQGDGHHERAVSLLTEVAEEVLVTSPITLAEVLVGPARAGRAEMIMNRLGQLPVGTVELGHDSPLRLAGLRVATGLKMPDCCVLLAAEHVAGMIATFDQRLGEQAEALGLRTYPLSVP